MENWIILAATPAVGEGPVEQIVKTFGVNWPLFISQCIAFLIVALDLDEFCVQIADRRLVHRLELCDRVERRLPSLR